MNDTRIDDNSTGLKFATLIRVSTERQELKGESLRTQKKRLESCIEMLGGTLFQHYEGQEHASEGYERKKLNSLLADAKLKLFDAVMVCDVSRWSRDDITALQGLRTLRENGIKFYLEMLEFDLSNPESEFTLSILSAAAKLQVNIGAMKSIQNRIERAKRGWPVCGNPPFGRRLVGNGDVDTGYERGKRRPKKINVDRKGFAQWEIIPKDQELVNRMFDLYVKKGLGFEKIEALLGLVKTHARYILVEMCGDEWIQTFTDNKTGKTTEIVTKIPPLLTPEQIAAVKHRAKTNQQFREIKYQYPLSHFVRCGICGETLTSMAAYPQKGQNYRIYFHLKPKTPECVRTIRGELLEDAVFAQLGQMLKNSDNLKEAIQQVLDRTIGIKADIAAEMEQLGKRREELNAEKSRVISKVFSLVRKGLIDESDAEKELNDIKSQLKTVEDRINQLAFERVKMEADFSSADLEIIIKQYYLFLAGRNGYSPVTWSIADKQKLARFFFGTLNKNLGVFVKPKIHPELGKYHSFLVRGMLGTAIGAMSKEPFEGFADMYDANPSGAVPWDAEEQARLARQFFGAEGQRDNGRGIPTGEVNVSDLKDLFQNLDVQQMPNLRPKSHLHDNGAGTTASTISECARVLHSSGAITLEVWAISRASADL